MLRILDAFHRQGIGRRLVFEMVKMQLGRECEDEVTRAFRDVVFCHIVAENMASEKLFASCGFEKHEEVMWLVYAPNEAFSIQH